MKRLLSLAIMAIGLAEAQAQDVKVEFITPSIVHVVKGQPTKTLVITAKPEQVKVVKKGNITSEGQPDIPHGQRKSSSEREELQCKRGSSDLHTG